MKKFILCMLLAAVSQAYGAEHRVKMLDWSPDGQTMIFEPGFLKVAPGDTVIFEPTQKGHNVMSKVVPEGATSFRSELDETFRLVLDKEGVYLYVCPPHQMMGMVGIIQVGEAKNLQKIKEAIPKLERVVKSNKGRWEAYAKNISGYGQ
ncbi:plastocyanin/azurin family copper-binding protein [Basilea psittacipulmonis]|uniref:Pseudoazurin n=1 Tax=Basilea psittacipulmonis DSM 24701 TaxID=1072685 RepID=A0A077DGW4_9BURK|nr:plastocyanin/azurin family copper-binding protein [Basilea psittacipulmonis]AIL33371.1 pseudoazurin [Basilea psittacipulmonis DSM 24701]